MHRIPLLNQRILLLLFFCAGLLAAVPVQAQTALNGNGTEADPYLISNVTDLTAFATLYASEYNTYKNKVFSLTADIDLNNSPWTPVGTDGSPFYGTFHGNRHTISGLHIENTSTVVSAVKSMGFFGCAGLNGSVNTTIDNLTLAGTLTNQAATTSDYFMGAFMGRASGIVNITNCINHVTVLNKASGNSSAAGFVGQVNNGTLSLTRCANKGSITSTGSTSIAAFIGRTSGGVSNLNYCYNAGTITSGSRACLVVAWIGTSANAYNCYNYGALNGQSTDNNYLNNGQYATAMGTVRNCYSNTAKSTNDNIKIIASADFTSNELAYLLNKNNYNVNSSATVSAAIWHQGTDYPVLEDDGFVPTKKITINYAQGVLPNATLYMEENGTLTLEPGYTYYTDVAMTQPFGNTAAEIIDGMTLYAKAAHLMGLSISVSGSVLTAVVTFDGSTVTSSSVTTDGVTFDLTFQWKDADQNPISGATSASYTMPDKTLDYSVIATFTPRSSGAISYTSTCTYAYGRVIYVKAGSGGNDANNGLTPSTPVKTFTKAYQLLTPDAPVSQNIVVLMDNYTNSDFLDSRSATEYEAMATTFNKKATITGKYNGVTYPATLKFSSSQDGSKQGRFIFADTQFEYINFTGNNNNTFLYCQGHNLTMGDGLTMTGYATAGVNFKYGTTNMDGAKLPNFCIFGGWPNYFYATGEEPFTSNDVCRIHVKSGRYLRIISGCRQTGTAGTSHVIGNPGNPFKVETTIEGEDTWVNLLCGGQTDGSCYINSTINIQAGHIGRILGGTIGYNYKTNEVIRSNTFFGRTVINLNGGTVQDLFGGNLGRNTGNCYFYGTIQINISGGTVTNDVYAAGAGGITGYNADYASIHSDVNGDSYPDGPLSYNRSTFLAHMADKGISQNVEVNVSGGTLEGNLYGGGYGFSLYLLNTGDNDGKDFTNVQSYLNSVTSFYIRAKADAGAVYCNTNVNISGGTVKGNVFGGGRGTDIYRNLALLGGSKCKTTGAATQYLNLAQIYGNTSVNITGGSIKGDVFGGSEGIIDPEHDVFANMAKVNGSASIILTGGTVEGNIYGGGDAGDVTGNGSQELKNGEVKGNVYGGGNKGDVLGRTSVVVGQ